MIAGQGRYFFKWSRELGKVDMLCNKLGISYNIYVVKECVIPLLLIIIREATTRGACGL